MFKLTLRRTWYLSVLALAAFAALVVLVPQHCPDKFFKFNFLGLIAGELVLSALIAVLCYASASPLQLLQVALTISTGIVLLGGIGSYFSQFTKALGGGSLIISGIQLGLMNLGGILAAVCLWRLVQVEAKPEVQVPLPADPDFDPMDEPLFRPKSEAAKSRDKLPSISPEETISAVRKTLTGIAKDNATRGDLPAQPKQPPAASPTHSGMPAANSTAHRLQAMGKKGGSSTFTKLQALSASGTGSLQGGMSESLTSEPEGLKSILDRLDSNEDSTSAKAADNSTVSAVLDAPPAAPQARPVNPNSPTKTGENLSPKPAEAKASAKPASAVAVATEVLDQNDIVKAEARTAHDVTSEEAKAKAISIEEALAEQLARADARAAEIEGRGGSGISNKFVRAAATPKSKFLGGRGSDPKTDASPAETAPSEPETNAEITNIEPVAEAPVGVEPEAPEELETPAELEAEAPAEIEAEAPTEQEAEAPVEGEAPAEFEAEAPTEIDTAAPVELEVEAPVEVEEELVEATVVEAEIPQVVEQEIQQEIEQELEQELVTQAPAAKVAAEPETANLFGKGVDSDVDDIFSSLAPAEAQREFDPNLLNKEEEDEPPPAVSTKAEPLAQNLFGGAVDEEVDDIFSGLTSASALKEFSAADLEEPKVEVVAPAPVKAESPKPEPIKPAPVKVEAPKPVAPKVELPKVEAPKPVAPKAEAPKPEAPKPAAAVPKQAPKERDTIFDDSVNEELDDIFSGLASKEAQMTVAEKLAAAKEQELQAEPEPEPEPLVEVAEVSEVPVEEEVVEEVESFAPVEEQNFQPEPPPPSSPSEGSTLINPLTKNKEVKEFGRLSARSSAVAGQASTVGTMKTIGKLLLDVQAIESIIKSGEEGTIGAGLANARVISTARGEGIKALLSRIDQYEGVVGSLIVGHDGLVIASTVTGGMDKDALGALSTALLSTSNLATLKLDIGKLRQMVMLTGVSIGGSTSKQVTTVLTDVEVGILAVFLDSQELDRVDGLLVAIHETIHG